MAASAETTAGGAAVRPSERACVVIARATSESDNSRASIGERMESSLPPSPWGRIKDASKVSKPRYDRGRPMVTTSRSASSADELNCYDNCATSEWDQAASPYH